MFLPYYAHRANTTEIDDTTVTVYIQPNIRYFSKEHAPYVIIAALVLLVFGILPALLLAVYSVARSTDISVFYGYLIAFLDYGWI